MYIHEATTQAMAEGRRMMRMSGPFRNFIRIRPTNTPDGCFLETTCSKKRTLRGWEPDADDLMADDWEVVD